MKGEVDPVTEVDRASEKVITNFIRQHRPQDQIWAEEGGGQKTAGTQERTWLVDPLDGTVNYITGIPQVAVSVALWEERTPLVGVIIDVHRGEEFVAAQGEGAFLNGEQISCQKITRLQEGVIGTGFPYDRQNQARAYAAVLAAVLEQARGIRRMGAAALDLAWVAAGRLSGYWEFGLSPWDAAAGILIATEAGAVVTDHLGKPAGYDAPGYVVAPPGIHSQLLAAVRSVPLPSSVASPRQKKPG